MIEDGVVIRPLTRRDLPAMAVMRRKVFRTSAQPDPEALARYYELVLFDGPWMSDDLPSLVATTRSGRVLGFQALVQRPFRLGDRALRCAVATEFMVDPDSRRRGVGGLLVRALFDGPQDFTLTDRCNAAARRLFESLGGSVSTWHSWYWTAVLRPARHAIGQLGWRGIPKLSTPLTSAFDAAVTRVVPGTFRQSLPRGSEGGLDPSIVPRLLPDFAGTGCLIPAYTSDQLHWLLRRLDESVPCVYRSVRKRTVAVEPEGVVGWFIAADRPDRITETVQFAAHPAYRELVFDHLLHQSWAHGSVALRGRLSTFTGPSVVRRRLRCTLAEPWVVFHSRDPEIAAAIESGRAVISRLDAEWWLAT